MDLRIYQINWDRNPNRLKFQELSEGQQPDPASYDEVFRGNVDCQTAEDVYRDFNDDGHPLQRGHSLSVSDVIVMEGKAYICQPFGFREVSFDETQTQKPDNLLRIVYVEPGREPFESEIVHDIDAMQRAVDGIFEFIHLDDDTILVANDEAKLRGMEGNRRLEGGSIIAGPFFLVRDMGENIGSLTDEQVAQYLERFAEPELITQREVQEDNYMIFISW